MDHDPLASFRTYFGAVPDPRVERAKRHHFLDILVIAVCGVICNADTWVDIEEFGKAKEPWFRSFLALPHGIPSHDTFGRVFARLDPEAFQRSFLAWAAALHEATGGKLVALDGKTLRRAHDQASGKAALHLVSAWAGEQHVVLGQRAVDGHSNEITALPALLDLLTLEGCTVTIDAMGTQKAIARQVRERGADYVLALKDNQPGLAEAVRTSFTEGRTTNFAGMAHDGYETVNGGHGRVETRRYATLTDPDLLHYLNPAQEWPDLRSIGMVEAERQERGRVSVETRYYLSSLAGDARAFGEAVRGHWAIENGLHWVLDLAFREDENRVRSGHAQENLATLRRLALNLLRHERSTTVGIKTRRLKAGWSEDYLLRVLTALAPAC